MFLLFNSSLKSQSELYSQNKVPCMVCIACFNDYFFFFVNKASCVEYMKIFIGYCTIFGIYCMLIEGKWITMTKGKC